MFPWTRKRLKKTNFFKGYTDCHCHILPGVDDGLEEIEDALLVLDYYEELGITKVIMTPHIMSGQHSDIDRTEMRFEKLLKAYKGHIELRLAAEYMLDEGFKDQIKRGLKCVEGDRVLVETSYFAPPLNMDDLLADVCAEGFTPLIAHPERYTYMDYDQYKELKQRGYLFQLDLLSLSRLYGNTAYDKSRQMLIEGMYDMVGTDLHSMRRFRYALHNIRVKRKELKALNRLKG